MNNRVIALGFFDGVHLGHAALLRRAVSVARANGFRACALTYDTHPSQVIGGRSVKLLNTTQERCNLMYRLCGIDEVIVRSFDHVLEHTPWDEFVREILVKDLRAAHLVVGYDFRFGFHGEGTPQKLQTLAAALGVGVEVVDRIELDGVTVSSTHIRSLIEAGEMETAARFLGHPHCTESTVHQGVQLGRTLGLPTINQHFAPDVLIPPRGVYCTRVEIRGAMYPGVTNVGVRPTVSQEGVVKAETHILDFSGDLYGETVRCDFYHKLRDERRFESVDVLRSQITCDIASARSYFQCVYPGI